MSINEIQLIKQNVLTGKAATAEEIIAAEKSLGLKFAEDYKEYLLTFGNIAYEGHELTGICKSKRLNVVDVTKKLRERIGVVPKTLYVIEETNYDGIVFWQNSKGIVYKSLGLSKPKKAYNSLEHFMSI